MIIVMKTTTFIMSISIMFQDYHRTHNQYYRYIHDDHRNRPLELFHLSRIAFIISIIVNIIVIM